MLWAVLLLCCFLLVWWSSRRHDHSSEPPSYPGRLPIIGHIHLVWDRNAFFGFIKTVSKYFIEQLRCEPGTFSLGPYKTYLFSDPDDCWKMSNACLKKHYVYRFTSTLVDKGLLTSDAETWKRDRKLLNPAFSFTVLNEFLTVFNNTAKQFVADIASQVGKGPFKPDEFIADFVLKTTCRTNLNLKADDNIVDKYKPTFEEILDVYMERFRKFWLHKEFMYKFSQLKKKEIALTQIIHDITKQVILKTRSELQHNIVNSKEEGGDHLGKCNKPFIDLLIQLDQKQGIFTEEVLIQHLNTVIVGTYDTTYKAIMYVLLLIGSHKHVQERIFEELQERFGDNIAIDVNNEDLSKLVYLEAAIKETLRLYPVIPIVARTSEEEIKIKTYTIPANSNIAIFIYAMNRSPIWGRDAEEYRPERWLEPGGVPDNPNALGSFGVGKRSCIGKRYAMMMLKTTLAHFLTRYKIAGDVSKLHVNMDFMMTPTSGHEISLELRK